MYPSDRQRRQAMAYFSAAEAAELAMEVGEVGQAYYRLLAQSTRYPRMRALLMDIAKEEAAHAAAWAALCDGRADVPVQSEEEWQEYRQYVREVAHNVLPYGPDDVLAAVQRAKGERDVIEIARELAESINGFVGTLYDTVSLDGCQSVAEQIMSDQASRLRDLEQMLWSTATERVRSAGSQAFQRVALSAEERELSPLVPVVSGD
jgi:rubrerythrin